MKMSDDFFVLRGNSYHLRKLDFDMILINHLKTKNTFNLQLINPFYSSV